MVPMPPIPFYTSSTGIWGFPEKVLQKDLEHSIQMSYDQVQDISADTHIEIIDGKRRIIAGLNSSG